MTILAIFGPSGSGKTTLAKKVAEFYRKNKLTVSIISQDNYYRDFSNLTKEAISKINFDDPKSIDFSLLGEHLLNVRNGKSFIVPNYDYHTTQRSFSSSNTFDYGQITIVEGHLLLANPELYPLFDFVIYVDVTPDVSLLQRVRREINLAGKVSQYTLDHYADKIAPMLHLHIVPHRDKANFLYRNEESFIPLIDQINSILSKPPIKLMESKISDRVSSVMLRTHGKFSQQSLVQLPKQLCASSELKEARVNLISKL